MKNSILFLTFFIAIQTYGQRNSNSISADKHFERLEYAHAIEDYLDDIQKGKATDKTFERLAISYENIANYKEAERYYRRLAKGTTAKAENILGHARTLKSIGKLDEYKRQMQRFVNLKPNDPRAKSYANNVIHLEEKMNIRPIYEVSPVSFNTKNSDFGAVRYGDILYFASAKIDSRKKHAINEEPLLDIYTATINKEGKVGPINSISKEVNTKYHEGIITQSKDGKRIYFDRNNYTSGKFKKAENGINQLQIYYADLVNGQYEVKKAPFNDDDYSTAHPAISEDGKTLYFVSDRPGGMGKGDIWKVNINEDGSFGMPYNIGTPINTPDNEVFPFVTEDGTLYFSSNGHSSFGGLDNFMYQNGQVVNLGPPINTQFDDFSFKPYNNTSGYLASNRDGLSDDIYAFELLPPCELEVTVLITDTEGNPISDASLVVLNTTTNHSEIKPLNSEAKITFTSQCDISYQLDATAEGYENANRTFVVIDSDTSQTLVMAKEKPLITETAVILNPIYFEFDRWDITPEAAMELDRLVEIMNENPDMVIEASSYTDERGSSTYNLKLSDRRAKSMQEYIMEKGISADRIIGIGKGETNLAVNCKQDCTEEEHQLNRRSEFVIVKR